MAKPSIRFDSARDLQQLIFCILIRLNFKWWATHALHAFKKSLASLAKTALGSSATHSDA